MYAVCDYKLFIVRNIVPEVGDHVSGTGLRSVECKQEGDGVGDTPLHPGKSQEQGEQGNLFVLAVEGSRQVVMITIIL